MEKHELTESEMIHLSNCMCWLMPDNVDESFNETDIEIRWQENYCIMYECPQTGDQEWLFNFNMN